MGIRLSNPSTKDDKETYSKKLLLKIIEIGKINTKVRKFIKGPHKHINISFPYEKSELSGRSPAPKILSVNSEKLNLRSLAAVMCPSSCTAIEINDAAANRGSLNINDNRSNMEKNPTLIFFDFSNFLVCFFNIFPR